MIGLSRLFWKDGKLGVQFRGEGSHDLVVGDETFFECRSKDKGCGDADIVPGKVHLLGKDKNKTFFLLLRKEPSLANDHVITVSDGNEDSARN